MKPQTVQTFSGFGLVLAWVVALAATPASAANRLYNFGLHQVWSECAGTGR